MPLKVLSFAELNEGNPCVGCPAPCCRIQLFPLDVPRTFSDLDYIRYMLLFPGTEFVVSTTGEWSMLKWADCRELELGSCTCKVHGTPAQPRICVQYNAYNCWYQRNFVTTQPLDLYRLDRHRFEVWIKSLGFDADRRIVSAPTFEESVAILAEVPIEPALALDPRLTKGEPAGCRKEGAAIEAGVLAAAPSPAGAPR